MYTEHEKIIKVLTISYKEGEEVLVKQRIERLHHFVEHLGFLVSALLHGDANTIRLFVEPHMCPCAYIPYKESIKLTDLIAIEAFCKNNGLTITEMLGLSTYIKRTAESELDALATEIDEFN